MSQKLRPLYFKQCLRLSLLPLVKVLFFLLLLFLNRLLLLRKPQKLLNKQKTFHPNHCLLLLMKVCLTLIPMTTKKIPLPSPLTPRPNLTLSFFPTRMISRPFGITTFLMKPSGLPALLLLLLWVQDLSCFNALILIFSNFEMVLPAAGLFSLQTLPFLP